MTLHLGCISDMKRNLLLSFLALLVIIIAIAGYFALKGSPMRVSPLQAMGKNVLAVLRINDYEAARDRLLFNNLMWEELLKDSHLKSFNKKLLQLDSSIQGDPDMREIISDLEPNISFHPSGDGFNHTLFIPLDIGNQSVLSKWISSNTSGSSVYTEFEEEVIHTAILTSIQKKQFYYAILPGLAIFSFKPDLVEDAIRTMHSGNSISNDPVFSEVEKTTGDFSHWNLLIDYSNHQAMNLFGLNPDYIQATDVKLSGWTALDATLHPNLFLLNGFTHTSNTSFLSAFYGQKSQHADVIDIMPENVSMFFHFGVSNYVNYTASKRTYFRNAGRDKEYDQKLSEMRNEYHFSMEEEFNQWVANEFGVFYLSGLQEELSREKVVYFRLSDKKRALNVLNSISGNEYHDEEIQASRGQLPVEGFLDHFETEIFSGLNSPSYIVVDKYLLFSNKPELLEFVKKEYTLDNTLRKSEHFASFAEKLTDQSNVFIYINVEEGLPVFRDILNQQYLSFLDKNEPALKKFKHFGIQFKDGKGNLFYQHLAMDYNPNQQSNGNLLWELALDTTIEMKPQIVYNHYTNAREIFVQDASNKVYLIDNKGAILWSKPLKEPIKSSVYQIDALKNNKLQILFSGESSIYLIDRKGRDVENFPIQLPAVTTNGLSVLDYEKDREYRILIGIRGGKILNFDRFGKPVQGWNFKVNEEIIGKVEYFVLNGKDYLVTLGSEGSPFVLNRRGEIRVPMKATVPIDENSKRELFNLDLSNDISQCKFVTTDATGNFVKLKFGGEKEIVNLDLFSEKFTYLYDDLNNDQKADYVVLDSNRLVAFDHSRQKLFEVNIKTTDPTPLNLYRFESGYARIGFTDKASGKIYMYRDAGSMHEGFPLEGTGEFTIIDLNKDGRFNLIVGNGKVLKIYNLE